MLFSKVIDTLARYSNNVDSFDVIERKKSKSLVIIVNFGSKQDTKKISDELDELTVDIDDNLVDKEIF